MMNVVMLVKNRPRLTHQALWSLAKNTDIPFNVTVVDDCSGPDTWEMLRMYAGTRKNTALLRNETSKGITGQARNLGIYWAEKYWGRGDWLYLSDNDAFFTPKWASKLTAAFEAVNARGLRFEVVGGQNHPYHHPLSKWVCLPNLDGCDCRVHEYNAVAGTSHLMRWDTWDTFGPMDAHAPGTYQSEDTAFCNLIRSAGGRVGAIWPHLVYDTGISQTDGSPSIGSDKKDRVTGVIYE